MTHQRRAEHPWSAINDTQYEYRGFVITRQHKRSWKIDSDEPRRNHFETMREAREWIDLRYRRAAKVADELSRLGQELDT
ncbi:MAG TPA: hypothetical protein VK735_39895 [Pseudonocardia sp.]|uniref:hypothetical protein n=1 Tax=Pseudonocardia sp. TaxID=60912 RepID=UPI002C90A0EC|nr:hypothetical protein [Pseudonocardia sp.]HTF53647.1 hypothetical protein [Pseudonocardia sp.]